MPQLLTPLRAACAMLPLKSEQAAATMGKKELLGKRRPTDTSCARSQGGPEGEEGVPLATGYFRRRLCCDRCLAVQGVSETQPKALTCSATSHTRDPRGIPGQGHAPNTLSVLQLLGFWHAPGQRDDVFLKRVTVEMRATRKFGPLGQKLRKLSCRLFVIWRERLSRSCKTWLN